MQTRIRKLSLNMFLVLSMTFIACDKDDNDDTVDTGIDYSALETARAAQADNTVEGTFNLLENIYVESVDGRSSTVSLFPSCALITIQPSGEGGTILVDFGNGCQLNNGVLVSGMVEIVYFPLVAGTRQIEYTFVNFTYNGNGVSGGGEILREVANQDGNPQSTLNSAITVSFPNSEVTASREGLRIAEWIEGVGSGTWVDNAYRITGNWTTTFSNGFERSGEVISPLVRELSCLYLVSGIIEVQQEGFTASIDWGDGSCDNMATLIIEDLEFPIIL